jgi:hypothetical protein
MTLYRWAGTPGTSIPADPRGIRNSQALNSGRPQLEHPLHIGNWHMAFKDHPVDNGGVARCQCARDARVALEGHPVAIIDHPHIATKGFFTCAAHSSQQPQPGSVHHVTCGQRGARKQAKPRIIDFTSYLQSFVIN